MPKSATPKTSPKAPKCAIDLESSLLEALRYPKTHEERCEVIRIMDRVKRTQCWRWPQLINGEWRRSPYRSFSQWALQHGWAEMRLRRLMNDVAEGAAPQPKM